MHHSIAVADMHMGGLSLKQRQFGRGCVGKYQMADINIGFNIGKITLFNKTGHLGYAVQKAESERLKLQSDLNSRLAGILTKLFYVLDGPIPLCLRWDHFLLPNKIGR